MAQQRFSQQAKQKAVEQCTTGGIPMNKVATDLGIGLDTLRKWKKEFGAVPATPAAAPDEAKRLEELFQFLRFASVSTDRNYRTQVHACADWLVIKLKEMGLTAKAHPTEGHPVIVAQNRHQPGRRTVLIYGHYDVQPVDDPKKLWLTPPFEPTVKDGVIYARGSTDNKGQIFAHIKGVEQAIAAHGDVPVNLTFLIEGEEEIGSPNLAPFLQKNRELLKCDVVGVSDTGMVGRGVPTMTYGLRGIACLECVLTGPFVDLHSGIYGGAMANPAMVLSHLVSSLHDLAQGKVQIEGFYDRVKPLQDWERKQWRQLPDGDKEMKEQTGVPALWGEEGYGSYERRWARPTAEVNGIGGGYQGEGSKTVIPKEAMVKFSFRLVPDQDPREIMKLAEKHLKKHCPKTVKLEVIPGHYGSHYLMDPFSKFGNAAQSALRKTFGKDPMLIREGGSIPIIQNFKETLGVDTLMLGLALPDCMAHAPNENFPVENFEAGIRLNQALLEELARA